MTKHPLPHAWKKGQSGNPGGRRKLTPDVKEALKCALPEAVDTLVNLLRHKDGRIRFLAAKELVDRNLGRTAQVVAALNDERDGRVVISWLGEDEMRVVPGRQRIENET